MIVTVWSKRLWRIRHPTGHSMKYTLEFYHMGRQRKLRDICISFPFFNNKKRDFVGKIIKLSPPIPRKYVTTNRQSKSEREKKRRYEKSSWFRKWPDFLSPRKCIPLVDHSNLPDLPIPLHWEFTFWNIITHPSHIKCDLFSSSISLSMQLHPHHPKYKIR